MVYIRDNSETSVVKRESLAVIKCYKDSNEAIIFNLLHDSMMSIINNVYLTTCTKLNTIFLNGH